MAALEAAVSDQNLRLAAVESRLSKLEAAVNDNANLSQEFEAELSNLAAKVDSQVHELQLGIEGSHVLLTNQITEVTSQKISEFTTQMEDIVRQEIDKFQEQIDGEMAERKQDVQRIEEALDTAIASLNQPTEALDTAIASLNQVKALRKETEESLEHAKQVMRKADMDLAEAAESQIRNLEQQLQQLSTKSEASALESQLDARITSLEGAKPSQDHYNDLPALARMVDNMYTRTVTWQIRSFSQKLHNLLEQRERVIKSEPFSLCAQRSMILDMLAAPEQEPSVPDSPIPPLPAAGSASFRLWAHPGFHLGFRLTLGEGSMSMTRRFEHTFQASEILDSEGRASFLMKNVCQLDQIWVKKANTVNITIEVLEMRQGDVATLLASAEEKVEEEAGTATDAPMSEDAKDSQLAERVAEMDRIHPDKMVTTRTLTTDTLMQERLQGQLQSMRNKTVRRIEWRLEGCSRLLDVMKAGEAVDSPLFSAAGIDKMQMHFYPRGCETSATVSLNGQPCALYVSGPYRTTLRGVLSVGSNKREFEQRYQRRGDVGGRGKFCSLESQVDMHDSVIVALEIVEMEADLPDMSSTLLFREAKHAGPASPGGGGALPTGGAKGVLRMKVEDPSKTEEVVRCISLPSLTTQKQFLPKVVGKAGGRNQGQRSR